MNLKKLFGYLVIAVAGGLIAMLSMRFMPQNTPQQEVVPTIQEEASVHLTRNPATVNVPSIGPDFTSAVEHTVNTVVHIRTEYTQKSSLYEFYFHDFHDFFDFFGDRLPQQRSRPIIATGSGVIISEKGYIVTNNHVVYEAEKITVTLNDRRSFEAKVVGNDPTTDLALIKIDANNLPYITYGNSDHVRVGEWVLAVGNPFNLNSTVTAGIVSAKARNINILRNPDGTTIESFIQTDAAVNRGNSGGALINTRGELIGINAAIASGTGYFTGYSFAIPVNIVRKVVDDFIKFGEVQRAFIGVTIRHIDSDFARENEIDELKGVYVVEVTDNGAAKAAGIKQGDIILSIEGTAVNTNSELLEIVGQHRPGDKVALNVRRNNRIVEKDVVLRNRDGNTEIVKREIRDVSNILGATFKAPSEELLSNLRLTGGVQIASLGDGALKEAGVREGFIIIKINNRPVNSTQDVENILRNKRGGVLIEGVYPNGARAYYGFGV